MSEYDLEAGLHKLGFDDFRPGQREAVETILSVGRLLLVAPTGGGKSLTYQLPATLLPGTTLVISPLISLMQDQVSALEARGVHATFLAATLDGDEMRRRLRKIAQGEYRLVYVSPERLAFPGFRALLRDLRCPLIAIDEAHCISEWGHDFRPEYMQIGEVLREFSQARILACTATATPIVRDEIITRLGLGSDTPQVLRGFARPNLSLRARDINGKRDRDRLIDEALDEALGKPGGGKGAAIIYSPTRKASEKEADRLAEKGWRVAAYHAGLDGGLREQVQKEFASGGSEVVVATNAFGMGIDRADVRAVLHLAPPSSVEAYYQEVGRAGRDGEDALGMLLISPGDMALRRHLIENGGGPVTPDADMVRHKWNLFLELMRWAEGGSCRHDAILRYFGDDEETLEGCGRCDVCLDLAGGKEEDSEEVSLLVRKALSAVARIHGRFGLSAAAKLLRGVGDERLEREGLHETRTFGILSDRAEEWLMRLLRRMVTAGWVDFQGGDRPVAVLTEEGQAVMSGERAVRLLLPPEHAGHKTTAGSGEKRRKTPDLARDLDEVGRELFDHLRSYRLELAQSQGVPPYVIASDRSLRDIAMLRPRTRDDLLLAHGIGPAKADRYGVQLLAIVEEFV
ncbi:MAG: ATP-dependent DNA helicase RecQ [Deltaproteobacteria bacterium]|nr:ATP-dependent DNA helicase RecQ [Deltaproteobacteria bacterium]